MSLDIWEVDSRLLGLTTPSDLTVAQPSFIDDDSIATYLFALGSDRSYFARQDSASGPSAAGASNAGGTAEPAFNIVTDICRAPAAEGPDAESCLAK